MNVGDAPWSATYDMGNGYVYVTNSGSNSVSVINGTKLVGTVNVRESPVHRSLRQRERLRLRAEFRFEQRERDQRRDARRVL